MLPNPKKNTNLNACGDVYIFLSVYMLTNILPIDSNLDRIWSFAKHLCYTSYQNDVIQNDSMFSGLP